MAIFDDKREIARQGQYFAPTKASGWNKFVLNSMGYDDSGKKNAWGHLASYVMPFGGIAQNLGAKAHAEGDQKAVIDAQTGSEVQTGLQRFQVSRDMFKTLYGGMAGGQGGKGSFNSGGGMMNGMFDKFGGGNGQKVSDSTNGSILNTDVLSDIKDLNLPDMDYGLANRVGPSQQAASDNSSDPTVAKKKELSDAEKKEKNRETMETIGALAGDSEILGGITKVAQGMMATDMNADRAIKNNELQRRFNTLNWK